MPVADRLAQRLTAPWPGLPLFLGATIGAFLFVTIVGGWLAGLLSAAWGAIVSPALAVSIPVLVPVPVVARSLIWSLDGGLLGMLSVGIPYVLTFYLLLAALEDSGYLTSAAVLMDRVFNVLGLPGRAAIPLLSAAGCNVPAIYGTRVLATRRERLLGAWLVTLTPCSARSAPASRRTRWCPDASRRSSSSSRRSGGHSFATSARRHGRASGRSRSWRRRS